MRRSGSSTITCISTRGLERAARLVACVLLCALQAAATAAPPHPELYGPAAVAVPAATSVSTQSLPGAVLPLPPVRMADAAGRSATPPSSPWTPPPASTQVGGLPELLPRPTEACAGPPPGASSSMPADFAPWWQQRVAKPMNACPGLFVTPSGLVLATLGNSAQVRVLKDSVAVRETAICEAAGRFDVRAFAESKYVNLSEPVGSTLTTGGPDRWLDSNWV